MSLAAARAQSSEPTVPVRPLRGLPQTAYAGETYYGLPAVRPSHYGEKTAASFFAEGIGGASQFLAALFDLLGEEEDRSVVRAGRYLALAASAAAPALLVSELQTKQRWYNMLRIFRPTSPMSIGAWSLSAFGLLSALTAGGQLLEDAGARRLGRKLGRLFGIPAAAAGGMLCLYIGTELEETATPLWSSTYPGLSPLFGTAAASNAAAALSAAAEAGDAPERTKSRLAWISLLAGGAEFALARRVEAAWSRLPGAETFRETAAAPAFRFGYMGLGILAPLSARAVRVLGGVRSRFATLFSSALTLAGGFLLPSLALSAGAESGKRPRDYFETAQPEGARPRGCGRRENGGKSGACAAARGTPPRSVVLGFGAITLGAVALAVAAGRRGGRRKR